MSKQMRATLWEGKPYHMTVKDWPMPKIRDPHDVVVRLTTAAICGTDLHDYHGRLGSKNPPWVMGHEGVGIITETGDAVFSFKKGDRVIISYEVSWEKDLILVMSMAISGALKVCGIYFDWLEESWLINVLSAEYVRVPFADESCTILPPGSDKEADFVMVSDVFCTAWWGLGTSGFRPGESVAVFGAGAVGLLAVHSAIIQGARVVYSIDHVEERLEKAKSIGAIPINFTKTDPVAEIMKRERLGVDRSLDCVGFECLNAKLKEAPGVVISQCISVTGPGGGIGLLGVYWPAPPPNAGEPCSDPALNTFPVPVGALWSKGLSVGGGVAEIRRYQPLLRDLIASGTANPAFVVTKETDIEGVPAAYQEFSARRQTKVLIRFPWNRSEEAPKSTTGQRADQPVVVGDADKAFLEPI
ncbi:alcohol dehydrogenase [Paecilomyces variotii No. 5]|uniref:Alcohol dehydrogenase n=1 Tax=Byssochlamys spectabilis (strain No. 5 / NBRC 109023) TaxID=1356009 RepID=V5FST7_BYSSN|nr:alcohol dehydrogenase [Paecilomyces variotii No. 5]